MKDDVWVAMEAMAKEGQACVLATVVRAVAPTSAKPGDRAVLTADGLVCGWVGGSCAEPMVKREARAALADGRSRVLQITPDASLADAREGLVVVPMTCHSGGTLEIFIEPQLPRPELFVFGRTPVAEVLVALGQLLNFRCQVVDPSERAPLEGLTTHRTLESLAIPPMAFVVVATHGVFDEEAIMAALSAQPRYLGVVGSRKRFASLTRRLVARGASPADLDRVHAPAGLDLGPGSPPQIALSILAEITAVQTGRGTVKTVASERGATMSLKRGQQPEARRTEDATQCCATGSQPSRQQSHA